MSTSTTIVGQNGSDTEAMASWMDGQAPYYRQYPPDPRDCFLPIRDIFGVKSTNDIKFWDLPKHFIAPIVLTIAVATKFFSNLNPVHAIVMTASTVLADKLSEMVSHDFLPNDPLIHQYMNAIFHVAATALQACVMTQVFSVSLATFATYYMVTNVSKVAANGALFALGTAERSIFITREGALTMQEMQEAAQVYGD